MEVSNQNNVRNYNYIEFTGADRFEDGSIILKYSYLVTLRHQ